MGWDCFNGSPESTSRFSPSSHVDEAWEAVQRLTVPRASGEKKHARQFSRMQQWLQTPHLKHGFKKEYVEFFLGSQIILNSSKFMF
jgi:hypothetical protein